MSLTVVHAWQLPSFDDGIDDIDRALLNHIHNGELVLPDLQRDFVWREADIRLLLDSILRDYPFGSLLLWNTQYLAVPYREFVKDSTTGQTFTTQEKGVGTKLRMVLDGQQRLQSLYIAIRGTYDGKRLYFNVTSGPDGEAQDGEEGRPYKFEFWQDDEVSRPKRLLRVADDVQERREWQRVPGFALKDLSEVTNACFGTLAAQEIVEVKEPNQRPQSGSLTVGDCVGGPSREVVDDGKERGWLNARTRWASARHPMLCRSRLHWLATHRMPRSERASPPSVA